jgi:putative FmdB family regulatory protein
MPVYDYRCIDCEHEFVIIESLGEHEVHEGTEPKCPLCASTKVARVIAPVNIQAPKKSALQS